MTYLHERECLRSSAPYGFADFVDELPDGFFEPEVILPFTRNFLRDWKPDADELWNYFPSVMDMINEEKKYLLELRKRHTGDKMYDTWNGIRERRSRERLSVLINRFGYDDRKIEGLDKARQYPLENIIRFTRDFAKCLWHNDNSPSLHLIRKANVAYCFSCQRAYDSLDAVQIIHGVTFLEAVKRLQ